MLVRVYLKNSATNWFDVDLPKGVTFDIPKTTSGIVMRTMLTIGENEYGPVFVREEDVTAIVPKGKGAEGK